MLWSHVRTYEALVQRRPDSKPDRTSLSKDLTSHDSQIYTQLAHAIVRFLGLNSPQELADFGMDSAGDLVDLVSRVRDLILHQSLRLTPLSLPPIPSRSRRLL